VTVRKKPTVAPTATATRGQLRYALVEAFLPLAVGLGVATLEGLPNTAAWAAFGAGAAVGGWRMIVYIGQ
jgi:hypothetical protein